MPRPALPCLAPPTCSYQAALGMYELELAYMVVAHSQVHSLIVVVFCEGHYCPYLLPAHCFPGWLTGRCRPRCFQGLVVATPNWLLLLLLLLWGVLTTAAEGPRGISAGAAAVCGSGPPAAAPPSHRHAPEVGDQGWRLLGWFLGRSAPAGKKFRNADVVSAAGIHLPSRSALWFVQALGSRAGASGCGWGGAL